MFINEETKYKLFVSQEINRIEEFDLYSLDGFYYKKTEM
jgi:hypothetical protein